MKIILANYRYFISGGPERYLFNLQSQLERQNHQIIPFSIDYEKNFLTPYSKYFVSPIGKREQIYFNQHSNSPSTFIKTMSRLFYSNEVEKAIGRLIEETSPDIAYVLHYLRKLSPSLLVGLKKKQIPIIVRLSDYMLLCPQAHFLRNTYPCTLCVPNKLFPSLRHKCVKESHIASILNLIATWYHQRRHFFDLVDTFVCTNQFMYTMMTASGYSEKRLTHIPTFVDLDYFKPDPTGNKSDYFVYSGRITQIKGLHILLTALGKLPKSKLQLTKLKIAGTGDKKYLNECHKIISTYRLNQSVEFLGEISTNALPTLLNKALFSIVPSLWYENLPNSILESYSCGTPVIASDIGSLAECVNEGQTGFVFEPGNAEDLADKLEYCLSNPAHLKNMSFNCRQEAKTKYSPKEHIDTLTNLFAEMV